MYSWGSYFVHVPYYTKNKDIEGLFKNKLDFLRLNFESDLFNLKSQMLME